MPETKDTKTSSSGNRDGLALVIGGLFILGLVFATYTYFNKGSTLSSNNTTEEKTGLDRLKEIISSNTDRDTDDEDDLVVDVDKLTDKNTADNNKEDAPPSLGTGGPVTPANWVATDYQQGEIKSGSYTVKSGDTLWEIAEAVYGNGAEWTRILNANSGSIGTLPSGQQALIMTGQVLNIPS